MESDWDVLVLDGNIKKKLGRRRFRSSSMLLPLMRVDFELDSMSAVLERAVTALNSLTLCSEVACSKAFQSFMIQSINVESTVRTEFEINQQQHATYTSIDPYFWSESPYGKNSPAYLGNICEDVLWGKHVTTFSISHCSEKALKATVCWGHAGPLTRCEQLKSWIQWICWEKCKSTVTSRIYQFFCESGGNFHGKPTSSKRACHRNLHLLNRSGLKKKTHRVAHKVTKTRQKTSWAKLKGKRARFSNFHRHELVCWDLFVWNVSISLQECCQIQRLWKKSHETPRLKRVTLAATCNLEHSYGQSLRTMSLTHFSSCEYCRFSPAFLFFAHRRRLLNIRRCNKMQMHETAWTKGENAKHSSARCIEQNLKTFGMDAGRLDIDKKHLFRSGKKTKSYKIHIHSQISNICPHASCFACP